MDADNNPLPSEWKQTKHITPNLQVTYCFTNQGQHLSLSIKLIQKNYVGTPGLGYPLLLCLGKKSFVVILNYIQQPDPYGPEALFTRQRSRTRPLVGKGPGAPRVPEEADAQPEQTEASDLPWRSGSPRNPGPPV